MIGGDCPGRDDPLMHVVSFPCPHCAIPLRVKDRGFVGRTIACPECEKPVTIADDGQGTLVGIPATESVSTAVNARSARVCSLSSLRLTPTTIGWVVAGCLVLGLGLFLLLPTLQRPAVSVAGELAVSDEPANHADRAQPPATDGVAKPTTVADRLVALHGVIAPSPASGMTFPVGTVAAEGLTAPQRFSWIAALSAARDPDGPQPQWDKGWSDPANERFVRRQLPQWLNPSVESVVSEQRIRRRTSSAWPASDPMRPSLPVDHPRAGIFGKDRRDPSGRRRGRTGQYDAHCGRRGAIGFVGGRR